MKRLISSLVMFFSSLFKKVNYQELVKNGAQILDVRTEAEVEKFGAIKDSINIPLEELKLHISQLNEKKPIIVCCENGLRSGLAIKILKDNGFKNLYKGGSWTSLKNKIKG